MIPGLSIGAGTASRKENASWAASWGSRFLVPKSVGRAAGTAARPHQQKEQVEADDEYSPESYMQNGEIESGPEDGEADDEDDFYEPTIPVPSQQQRARKIFSVEDDEADGDDDMYDPEEYDPGLNMDMSPCSYDSDGRASLSRGCDADQDTYQDGASFAPSTAPPNVANGATSPAPTLLEARKKAQASILRLWPLDVRFQQYLDEGIDETVVKGLFKDLGLDISAGLPRPVTSTTATPDPAPTIVSSSQPATQSLTVSDITPSNNTTVLAPSAQTSALKITEPKNAAAAIPPPTTASNPAEERKDRIARLLAKKKAEQVQVQTQPRPVASAPLTPASNTPTTSQASQQPPAAPKKPSLSEALQKQKQVMLEKMRARKAARQSGTQSSDGTPTPGAPPNAPTGPRAASMSQTPSAPSASKHPFAADMMPQSTSSLPSRPRKSFVIDLSSDEEEEHHHAHANDARHDPAFAPGSTVKFSSQNPMYGSQQQPGKQVEVLDRSIEMLKLKIAAMEARKSSSGSASPNVQSQERDNKAPALPIPQAHPLSVEQSIGNQSLPTPISATAPPSIKKFAPATQVAPPKVQKPEAASSKKAKAASRKAKMLPAVEAVLAMKMTKLQAVNQEALQLLKEIEDVRREKLRLEQGGDSDGEAPDSLDSDESREEGEVSQSRNKPVFPVPMFNPAVHRIPGRRPVLLPPRLVAASAYYKVDKTEQPGTMAGPHQATAGSSDAASAPAESVLSTPQQSAQSNDLAPPSLAVSKPAPIVVVSDDSSSSEHSSSDDESDNDVEMADATLDVSNPHNLSIADAEEPHDTSLELQLQQQLRQTTKPDAETSSSEGNEKEGESSSSISASEEGAGSRDEVMGDYNDGLPIEGNESGDFSHDDDDEYEPADHDEPMQPLDDVNGELKGSTISVGAVPPTPVKANAEERSSSPVPIWKQHILEKQASRMSISSNDETDDDGIVDGGPSSFSDNKKSYEISDVVDVVNNPRYPGAFVPYESMYKGLPLYCFHPSFESDIPAGLDSLTYSHSIDPKWAICTEDLGEEGCSVKDCPWQHLSKVRIEKDKLLVTLGNTYGLDQAEKIRFLTGLREVIKGIKSLGTEDFDAISKAIIAYRRRYMGDASKIRFMDVEI